MSATIYNTIRQYLQRRYGPAGITVFVESDVRAGGCLRIGFNYSAGARFTISEQDLLGKRDAVAKIVDDESEAAMRDMAAKIHEAIKPWLRPEPAKRRLQDELISFTDPATGELREMTTTEWVRP